MKITKTKRKFLAIIPARGGSKRLPRKNCLELKGKPLIAWTIEAALNSKYIDEVIVSSDDTEMIDISTQYGARTPFVRPKELSGDQAVMPEVVKHGINYLRDVEGKEFEYVILLQPTSPFRNASDIDAAIDFMEQKKASAIVSVSASEHPIEWYNKLPADLSMKGIFKSNSIKLKRSQDFPIYYRLNGAIYICEIEKFFESGTYFLDDNIFAFVMDIEKSIDIDSKIDFKLAEAFLSLE